MLTNKNIKSISVFFSKRLGVFMLLITCYLLPITYAKAQDSNLVNNPSFEEFYPYDHFLASYCEDTLDRQDCPIGWVNDQVKYWHTPWLPLWFRWVTGERGGYYYGNGVWYPAVPFFPCGDCGYQPAKDGNALIWGVLWDECPNCNPPSCHNGSGYIETQLKQPLDAGKKYIVSFFVNKASKSKYSIRNVEALLTPYSTATLTNDSCDINLEPQIKNKYAGILTDTIGWTEIRDTMIAVGGEQYLTLGRFEYGAALDTVPTYFGADGNQYQSIYMIDMVSVVPLDSVLTSKKEIINTHELIAYPNPVADKLCLSTAFTNLVIYNNKGQQVYTTEDAKLKECVDVSFLSAGLYWIEVTYRNGTYRTKFVKE